ncbi:MAG: AAA family ATPase [Calditrichaeota bacterium]|nr:AAA family ATPase [Calditrichota bacterium]
MSNSFFKDLENTRPFLKMAFEGFPGTGKTYTASQIAIGLHRMIKSKKPIVFYDTERSLKALKPLFDKAGIKVLVKESRTLADLEMTMKYCEEGTADILIIDSISHVWESFVQAYMKQKKRNRLTLGDWGIIKPQWKERFSDKFVMSPIHIIFTGRAGYEFDFEEDEDGQKQLIKTGIKMRAETEMEYEPDIVVLMEKEKIMEKNTMRLVRYANVLKDRSTIIDGKRFMNPTFEDFKPAIDAMLAGEYVPEEVEETPDVFPKDGEDKRTQRQILTEEISGLFLQIAPGQSAREKKFRADLSERVFNTRSWTKVQTLPIEILDWGINVLQKFKREFHYYVVQQQREGLQWTEEEAFEILDKILYKPKNEKEELEQMFGPDDRERTVENEAKTESKAEKVENKDNDQPTLF